MKEDECKELSFHEYYPIAYGGNEFIRIGQMTPTLERKIIGKIFHWKKKTNAES